MSYLAKNRNFIIELFADMNNTNTGTRRAVAEYLHIHEYNINYRFDTRMT